MAKNYTILLSNDHGILPQDLRSILNNQSNFKIIEEVHNEADLLQAAASLKPDLLLTNISLSNKSEIEYISEIKKILPEIKVLVVDTHSSEEYLYTAFNAGANGYILKDNSHDELINAIDNVLNGKTYLSPTICAKMVDGYLNNTKKPTPALLWKTLTQREQETLILIADGYRNKDISASLKINIKTVEKHRSNLMKKLNLHSPGDVTNYALKNGLLNPT